MPRLQLFLALLGLSLGCSQSDPFQNSELNAVVASATEVTIYSLHPNNQRTRPKSGKQPPEESFRDYPILGIATLTAAQEVQAVVDALRQGLFSASKSSDCFRPRHGLRFEQDGHSYDFLICFECHHIYVFRDGDLIRTLLTQESPQRAFNDILSQHKVTLPPAR